MRYTVNAEQFLELPVTTGTIQNVSNTDVEVSNEEVVGSGLILKAGEMVGFNNATVYVCARPVLEGGTGIISVVPFSIKGEGGGGGGSYVLPIATKTVLGGVKSSDTVGKVTVNNDGTMTYNPLGYRQSSTAYTAGKIAYHASLPTGWYLECITAGTTGSGDLTISSPSIGDTVSDGTVTWRICNVNANTNYQKIAMARHTRTTFTLANLISAVADQNLDKYGIKVGDYYVGASGYTYIVAGLNPLKGTHEYTVTNNHCGLIVCTHTTHPWNASGNTYTGADNRGAGYANSDLHYYLVNTVLPNVKSDLGESHLYAHQKLFSNAVNTTQYNRLGTNSGGASYWSWYSNQYISALTEHQVYGGIAWSSSGFDTGEADQQLEVFKEFKHTDIFGNEYVWLRDVASASNACGAYEGGYAGYATASDAGSVAALIAFH